MCLNNNCAYTKNSTCTTNDRINENAYGMHPPGYLNSRLYLARATKYYWVECWLTSEVNRHEGREIGTSIYWGTYLNRWSRLGSHSASRPPRLDQNIVKDRTIYSAPPLAAPCPPLPANLSNCTLLFSSSYTYPSHKIYSKVDTLVWG